MILISSSDGRNVQKGTRSHAGEPSARKEAQAGSQEEEVSVLLFLHVLCSLVMFVILFFIIKVLEAYCFWLV